MRSGSTNGSRRTLTASGPSASGCERKQHTTMIGRRGSLRSSGESNCKRFFPYLHLQPSIPRFTGGGTLHSQATIALGGNFPSTFLVADVWSARNRVCSMLSRSLKMNIVECGQFPIRPECQDEFIHLVSAFRGCPRAGCSTIIETDTAFWMT